MSENGGLGDEIEAVIMQALTHRERRNILKIIDHSNGGVVYSGILGETGLSTGRLNYHLKELEGFIEKDEERRYQLTALGKKAIRLMRGIRDDLDESYEGYVSVAKASRRTFINRNLDRAFYVIAILMFIGPLFTVWLYMMEPDTWWIGGLTWTFYVILVYLMDRVRKGSPKYLLRFINWLEWRLYGDRSNIKGPKFPGSKLMIGLLIGVVIGGIFDKVGAGLLLGLFIGAAMEI
jgi:predicted transcriptional regulator